MHNTSLFARQQEQSQVFGDNKQDILGAERKEHGEHSQGKS